MSERLGFSARFCVDAAVAGDILPAGTQTGHLIYQQRLQSSRPKSTECGGIFPSLN
jgi:hypothetical protein